MSIVVDFPGGNVYHYKRLRTYEKCTGIQLYNCEYSLDISLVDERHKFCWIYIIETKEKHKT